MTQTSTQDLPFSLTTDTNGNVLFGKVPKQVPNPFKRGEIKKAIDLGALQEVFEEKNSELFQSAFLNIVGRKQARKKVKPSNRRQTDKSEEREKKQKLNTLVQRARKPQEGVILKEYVNLYKETQPWWKQRQEIIYQAAKHIVRLTS